MTKIKYPITVYFVNDATNYGPDQRGWLSEKTFEEAPDQSKLHHFDNHYHQIDGDYFFDIFNDYDSNHTVKYFLSKNKARKYAKKLTDNALKEARKVVANLEKQVANNYEL